MDNLRSREPTILTLITEQVLAPVPGGTGRYAREVAAAVGATVPDGWRVGSVVALHRTVRAARVDGVSGPARLPVGPRILARLWERGLPPTLAGTVVHALTPLAPPHLRPGQALVVTVHDAVPYTHPDTLTPRGAHWHRVMIERSAAVASVLVVPTRAVAAALAAAGVQARMEVIGEGVAPGLRTTSAEAVRVRTRFDLPDRYLVAVGTLEPRKGLDVLLDALAVLGPAAPPLMVIGQLGWGGTDLPREAARRGLSGQVRVLGRLPDSEMAAVVAGAASVVVPSRTEGFGLPVLEAMSLGVPVIHSDAPALVEVAQGAGMAVRIGNAPALAAAIRCVLDDRRLAARMSTAGRLRAADFSWDAVAQQLWTLYTDIAPAFPPPRTPPE